MPDEGDDELRMMEVLVLPGQEMTITRQPVETFKAERFEVDKGCSPFFEILDIRWGWKSQIATALNPDPKPISATSFVRAYALMALKFDAFLAHHYVVVVVRNTSAATAMFKSRFVGRYQEEKA